MNDEENLRAAITTPAPPLDSGRAERVLERARAEVLRPGEGGFSLPGLRYQWQRVGLPGLLLVAGAFYAAGAVQRLALIF